MSKKDIKTSGYEIVRMETEIRQHRGFCFTLNNYTEEDLEHMNETTATYLVYGKEVGESGTRHLQGYLYYSKKASFTKVKKFLPRAHIEVQKGSCQQAIAYCKKDGDYVEIGEPPSQGKRTDLDAVKEKLKKNEVVQMRDIVLSAKSYQSVRMAETILKYHEIKRDWKPYVRWFWGATGTGKTREAHKILGADCYTAMETNKWWEGYDAHENVIIDDMRGDFAKFHVLLRLLDRYEYRLEIKGGSRQFLARNIIITSCHHPNDMFDTREDIGQLLRRIDEIVEFN